MPKKRKKWSREKVIEELMKIKEKVGNCPKCYEISSALLHACQRYFGSFNKAKEAAGLEVLHPINYKYELPDSAYKPSKEFAWLVGYILGDGFLTQGNVIGAKTKDKELKDFFIKNFTEWSGRRKFTINYEKEKIMEFSNGVYVCEPIWVVRVCFKEAFLLLEKFKKDPFYSLKFFPRKYWKYTLKGLWDAEGDITYQSPSNIRIGFTNYDQKILDLYKKICSALDFHIYCNKEKVYISTMPDVLNFINRIGITVKRKFSSEIRGRVEKAEKLKNIYLQVTN